MQKRPVQTHNESKRPILFSYYIFLDCLRPTNFKTNLEQFSTKVWEKLRAASLNLNFTGSYILIRAYIWLMKQG